MYTQGERIDMTQTEFIILCELMTVSPVIALENETVVEALKAKTDVDELLEILKAEF